ncbi:hypothetical protein D3C72_1268200 [compost metagenome]
MKKATLALALVTVVGSFANAGDPIIPNDFGQKLVLAGITFSPTLTLMAPFYSSEATTQGKLNKVVQAREDIAYFVASEGAVRTVNFNEAMATVREVTGDNQSQDMDLAQAILAELQ